MSCRYLAGRSAWLEPPFGGFPAAKLIRVKGGKTGVKDVRDLRGVVGREMASIGVLISLQPPARDMAAEAVSAGFYEYKTCLTPLTPFTHVLEIPVVRAGRKPGQSPPMPPLSWLTLRGSLAMRSIQTAHRLSAFAVRTAEMGIPWSNVASLPPCLLASASR